MKERPRPKKDDDEEEGGDEWLLTYGDLMTQLVCFFVLMMSFAVISENKFREVVVSLHDALSGTGVLPAFQNVIGDIPRSVITTSPIDSEALSDAKEAIDKELEETGMSPHVETEIREEGLVIILNQSSPPIFFNSGDARIRDQVHPVLGKIGQIIKGLPNDVRIEGHTDNRPINTSQFPSNWELSMARATNVLKYLHAATGIAPNRLSAGGYGPYRPVASNDTSSGRAKNRRVEIVILRIEKAPGQEKIEQAANMQKNAAIRKEILEQAAATPSSL